MQVFVMLSFKDVAVTTSRKNKKVTFLSPQPLGHILLYTLGSNDLPCKNIIKGFNR